MLREIEGSMVLNLSSISQRKHPTVGLRPCVSTIQNLHLTARCREKSCTRTGPEFGSKEGTIVLARKAFYGLKSARAAFRSLPADTLVDIGNY